MQKKDQAENQQDELIFGKNAVLSFLEQCEEDDEYQHKRIQNALTVDALDEARRASADIVASSAVAEELEHKIRQAVGTLRERNAGAKLNLPVKPSLEPGLGIKVNKIMLATGLERDERIRKIKVLARQQQIPVHDCDRKKLDQLAGPQRRHQGVLAMVSPAEMWLLDTFLQKLVLDRIAYELEGRSMDGYMLAVVDGIEDPHNLGAIIRVAEASGAKGLFLPQRRAAGLTGTVAKTSAGALASLPVVRVSNLVQCLETLKKYGFWVAALDVSAPQIYDHADFKRPLVVVIGSEGTGISRLVKEHCDFLVKIPMLGKTESLNASVAAGILFYEVVRQNKDTLMKSRNNAPDKD